MKKVEFFSLFKFDLKQQLKNGYLIFSLVLFTCYIIYFIKPTTLPLKDAEFLNSMSDINKAHWKINNHYLKDVFITNDEKRLEYVKIFLKYVDRENLKQPFLDILNYIQQNNLDYRQTYYYICDKISKKEFGSYNDYYGDHDCDFIFRNIDPHVIDDKIMEFSNLTFKQINDLAFKRNGRYSFAYLGAEQCHYVSILITLLAGSIMANILLRDYRSKLNDILHTQIVTSYQYWLSKFFSLFFILVIFLTVIYFGVGFVIYRRCNLMGYRCGLFDSLIPLYCHFLPGVLFNMSLISLLTICLKKELFSTSFCVIINFIPNLSLKNGESIGSVVFKLFGKIPFNLAIDQANGITPLPANRVIITLIAIIFLYLSCYIWQKCKTKI